jgi:hypothetical protein
MEITVRELKGKDIFALSKIVKKINLDLSSLKIDKNDNFSTGISFLKAIFENLHLVEKEANDFFASLTGLTSAQVADLNINEYLGIVNKLKENKEILGFFKSAGK